MLRFPREVEHWHFCAPELHYNARIRMACISLRYQDYQSMEGGREGDREGEGKRGRELEIYREIGRERDKERGRERAQESNHVWFGL